jgi:glucose-6-phosphate dehydrogenase assembly protein OpcA
MGIVSDIERQLGRLRAREESDGMPELRTSTMTHLVWCPPEWRAQARATLAGLLERHPARTIFLIPDPGGEDGIRTRVELRDFELQGLSREVLSEVIEIRLGRTAMRHPASVVLPLLVSDLPVFCRWRGEPGWASRELTEIAGVADRLVVDSSEWRNPVRGYEHLCDLFPRIAVSDIAYARLLPWRRRLAELWPEIATIERLRVEGPRADTELLAGWLRARLQRDVTLTRRNAAAIAAVQVDGEPVRTPGEIPSASELLSGALDQFGRDPIYEEAVRAVIGKKA